VGAADLLPEIMNLSVQLAGKVQEEAKSEEDRFYDQARVEYTMAMKFFDQFQHRVNKEQFFAAAVTYAYYLRHCAVQNARALDDVTREMSSCLLDGCAEIRAVLNISMLETEAIYAERIEVWPPLHCHPAECVTLLSVGSAAGYREKIKT